jgi:catechol 2,3-dioxygenase
MARKHFLAHLAHVEIITPKLEESVAFFRDVVGLDEAARHGQSVYMRCWGDYYHHSLILTPGPQPALGHGAWRTHGPEELEAAVASIEAAGTQGEWVEESLAHGKAYRFKGPGGQSLEIFWEVERYVASPEQRSAYPDRPQRRFSRGISPRQLDHLTIATGDVMRDAHWYRDTLGYRFMGYTSLEHDPNRVVFGVTTTNETSHDLGLGGDFSGIPGRVHHMAFWMEESEDLLRAADLLIESGTPVEFGPGRHGIGEQMYLYFREPGGMRIELNSLGYRNYVPDWEAKDFKPSLGGNAMYRNVDMPNSMLEAFPPAPEPAVGEPEMAGNVDQTGALNAWSKQGH